MQAGKAYQISCSNEAKQIALRLLLLVTDLLTYCIVRLVSLYH
jgi:hypothetical protein